MLGCQCSHPSVYRHRFRPLALRSSILYMLLGLKANLLPCQLTAVPSQDHSHSQGL